MESNKTNSHNILGLLEEKKIRVSEVNIDSTPEATVLRLIVKLPGKMKAEQVVEDVSSASGVTGAHWKR
ncbi:MAG: hypothetical protein ACYC6O_06590 [Thermoleophilia bacterium]